MKTASIVGLTILCGSLCLAAQNGDQSQLPSAALIVVPEASPCPIGMHVRQGIGSQMLAVKDGHRTQIFASRLRLNLSAPQSAKADTAQITAATVTVHGLNGKARMQLTGSSQEGSADVAKTMNVTFSPDDDKSVWTDLVLPGFASANMVVLESVTYADGSTWRFTGHQSWCQAAPDPIMLIENR